MTVHDVVSDDDLVMYEATLTMTHEGEFDGIPPTGREVEVREMATYRVAEGEIQEYRVCFDRQAVFEQLRLMDEGDESSLTIPTALVATVETYHRSIIPTIDID